jgi:hypothetical protein
MFLTALFIIRCLELYCFLSKVETVFREYDRNYINAHEDLVPEYIKDKYYFTAEWSAFYFAFRKGPSIFKMFFKLNLLTFENIYSKETINRLKEYATI